MNESEGKNTHKHIFQGDRDVVSKPYGVINVLSVIIQCVRAAGQTRGSRKLSNRENDGDTCGRRRLSSLLTWFEVPTNVELDDESLECYRKQNYRKGLSV